MGKTGRETIAGLQAATRPSPADPSVFVTQRLQNTAYRISWRGDGAFFVISTFLESPRTTSPLQRRLRFYSRTAVFQSTSEPTPLLEDSLAWQPSGSIVAASANNGTQIVFFERNGLRRYDFELKEEKSSEHQSVVRQLAWNADSSILAVWVERVVANGSESEHVVQLWRRNN